MGAQKRPAWGAYSVGPNSILNELIGRRTGSTTSCRASSANSSSTNKSLSTGSGSSGRLLTRVPALGVQEAEACNTVAPAAPSQLAELTAEMLGHSFVLEPDQVEELMQRFELDEAGLLQSLIGAAQEMARPPISRVRFLPLRRGHHNTCSRSNNEIHSSSRITVSSSRNRPDQQQQQQHSCFQHEPR